MPRQERLPGMRTTGPEKSDRLYMRVSPEEKRQIVEMAKKAGVSVAGLVLGVLLGDLAGQVIVRGRDGK